MTDLEDAWREEWGRLLALLVAQFRRLDLAEDGLGDAFAVATEAWRRDGTPDNPPAWLLTAARRRIYDRLRAEAIARRKQPLLEVHAELTEEARTVMADAGETLLDERLRLVLLCAHPSLAPEHAAALTLRLVLGVSTADIARLFLVPTPTMAARLTRARKALAGVRFEVPSGAEPRRGSRRSRRSPTSPSPRGTPPAPASTCSVRTWRARRSAWCGCCGRCFRGGSRVRRTWTHCSP